MAGNPVRKCSILSSFDLWKNVRERRLLVSQQNTILLDSCGPVCVFNISQAAAVLFGSEPFTNAESSFSKQIINGFWKFGLDPNDLLLQLKQHLSLYSELQGLKMTGILIPGYKGSLSSEWKTAQSISFSALEPKQNQLKLILVNLVDADRKIRGQHLQIVERVDSTRLSLIEPAAPYNEGVVVEMRKTVSLNDIDVPWLFFEKSWLLGVESIIPFGVVTLERAP